MTMWIRLHSAFGTVACALDPYCSVRMQPSMRKSLQIVAELSSRYKQELAEVQCCTTHETRVQVVLVYTLPLVTGRLETSSGGN